MAVGGLHVARLAPGRTRVAVPKASGGSQRCHPPVPGVLLALWVPSPSSGEGAGRCFRAKNPATDFGLHKPIGKELSWRSNNPWKADSGVRYFRALIEIDSPRPTHWNLVVRDKDYRPIQILAPADLDAHGRAWTRRITEASVFFDLHSPERRFGVAGSLVEAVFMEKRLGSPTTPHRTTIIRAGRASMSTPLARCRSSNAASAITWPSSTPSVSSWPRPTSDLAVTQPWLDFRRRTQWDFVAGPELPGFGDPQPSGIGDHHQGTVNSASDRSASDSE